MKPTEQQQQIINHDANAVIIAAPGSGKTFVISEKIKSIFLCLKEHEGVIAISYTNKASNELQHRCLSAGNNPKASFFGTIDRFFISEIIIPFGKQIFGIPNSDIRVIKTEGLEDRQQEDFSWHSRDMTLNLLIKDHVEVLGRYFLDGYLLIETIGVFANYIFRTSLACRKYLKSRYRYIFIDEYQDSGSNQHDIFLQINALGIVAVAVGDVNQSIYAFSGKDSKYLSSLSTSNSFKLFLLNKNHRCHSSIINYSNFLLNPAVEMLPEDERRVFLAHVVGHEEGISKWIDERIEGLKAKYGITHNNSIAVLCRGSRTIDFVSSTLTTPYKISTNTDLDISLNIWSGIFSNLLSFVFDQNFRFIEVVEEFTDFNRFSKEERTKLLQLKAHIIKLFEGESLDKEQAIEFFIAVANTIAPHSSNQDSVTLLQNVLDSQDLIHSYKPASPNEINLMTIHKSKGLEFDAIIHLDLHEFILPGKQPGPGGDWQNPIYSNWDQDLNLHYVAITRAKKACVLISSSKRTNSAGRVTDASDSEFLSLNGIERIRFMPAKK